MITTKREEIRFKSGRLKALLFPYTLLVTESKYDYCYVKKIEADNPDANFEKFKTEMEIENFNGILQIPAILTTQFQFKVST